MNLKAVQFRSELHHSPSTVTIEPSWRGIHLENYSKSYGSSRLPGPAQNRFIIILFLVCLGIEFGFVILDLTVNWWKYSSSSAIRRMFNITREDGMATLFAVMQTLALGLTCWAVWLLHRSHPHKHTVITAGWLFLALFFTYMAIDDGALIHERIGTTYKKEVGESNLSSYGWQAIMAPMFAAIGVCVFLFLWFADKRNASRLLLIAGIGCLGTAVIIDYVEGTKAGYVPLAQAMEMRSKTVTHFAKSAEEFIEMLGITFLWLLAIRNLQLISYELNIQFTNGAISVNYKNRQSD